MKNKMTLVFMALALTMLVVSCSTTGEYLPLSGDELVIGTVQAALVVRSSFFSMKRVRDAINTEAYIKLLEAAALKYSGNIDIRDIVWVTGRQLDKDPASTWVFAAGKVIRLDKDEKTPGD